MRQNIFLATAILLLAGVVAGHGGAHGGQAQHAKDIGSGLVGADSPLYGLDIALDNVAMAAALKTAGDVAQERATEAKEAQNKGDNKAAEKAAKQMSKVAQKVKPGDIEGLQKAEAILQEVRTNAPADAQEGLQTALDNIQEARHRVKQEGNADVQGENITIDPAAETHIVGVTADGDVEAVKSKADSVGEVMDFGDIGKSVVGTFSVAALEDLAHRDDVRYIEPDQQVARHPEPPAPENYTCPQQEYVNCMPGSGGTPPACSGDFHEWVQQNCNVSFTY